ncbi:MAG: cysteine--tRNA ligase [Solirubrobacteraceae bacterium]
MNLRFYNTATREARDFVPLQAGTVGIYLCGLTVQSEPHVGHVRSAVNFDVLRRWLVARGYDVTLIRNITDIDDKILAKAAEQGRPWYNLAYAMRRELDAAYDALHVHPPTYEPAATGHVPEMLELIDALITKGHAYPAEDGSGDVYFDVQSWPDYGSLTHQKIADMEAAEDADPRGKRDPRDFALWKGAKPDEPASASWATRYGRGRPGWHLECSAMARKYLGDTFDIHGGGVDLRFPHPENEQAQSRAAGLGFARYWLHNAWVTVGGEKMSKSLGNTLIVSNLLQSVRPLVLRYYLGAAHYRSHIEYSWEALQDAAAAYERIEGFVRRAGERLSGTAPGAPETPLPAAFVAAMDDDLAVPQALAVLHDAVRQGNRLLADDEVGELAAVHGSVRAMLAVLGLDPDAFAAAGAADPLRGVVDALVAVAVGQREAARARKDYAAADAIRAQLLTTAGVVLEDTPTGTRWSLEGKS